MTPKRLNPTKESILEDIHADLYLPEKDSNTNVFLCGGSIENSVSIRTRINEKIRRELQFSVVYPEWLFSDLLSGKEHNLLELEKELAAAVDLIIIPLESFGTFAELGSFASNPALRQKTIVLNQKKYEHTRSFINLGPIALIRQDKPHHILYYNDENLNEKIDELVKKIRFHRKDYQKSDDLNNIFNLSRFLLHLIAIHQPISVAEIQGKLAKFRPTLQGSRIPPGLQILIKRRCLNVFPKGEEEVYSLSAEGFEIFQNSVISKRNKSIKFSKIRSAILNERLRKKGKFKFGEEALGLLEKRQNS